MGATISYILEKEQSFIYAATLLIIASLTVIFTKKLLVAIKQFPSRTCLILKNISPETEISDWEPHIDAAAELSKSGIEYVIVEKPGNLYLLVFKSSIGKFLCS